VVTHPLLVQEFLGSNPGPTRVFMFDSFCFVVVVFYVFVQKHIIYNKSLQFLLQS